MYYKRNIKATLWIYRFTSVLILLGCVYFTFLKHFDYLILFVIVYFIRDFVFSIYMFSINEKHLVISRLYLGGILRATQNVNLNTITKFQSIEIGAPNSILSITTENTGGAIFSDSDEDKNYELHLISYKIGVDIEKKIKIPLKQDEVRLLESIISLKQ